MHKISNLIINKSLISLGLFFTTLSMAQSLSKNVSPSSISNGGTATYTFIINNTGGGSIAHSSLGFTDTLPTGLQIAANPNIIVTGITAGSVTASLGGSSIVVSGYSIAANTTGTITVNITNKTGQINTNCGSNPAAFTNGAANISGLSGGLVNNVSNVCLVVTPCNAGVNPPVIGTSSS